MAIRHEGHRLRTHRRDATMSESARISEPYGIAQIFSMAFGVFFVTIGAIGLARTGLDSWTSPTTEVAGITATPLLSVIHLAVGVVALAAGAARWASRAIMTFFGAGMIALGVIALVERVDSLGWTKANGWMYIIAGALALIAAMLTPAVAIATREIRSDFDVGDTGHAHG